MHFYCSLVVSFARLQLSRARCCGPSSVTACRRRRPAAQSRPREGATWGSGSPPACLQPENQPARPRLGGKEPACHDIVGAETQGTPERFTVGVTKAPFPQTQLTPNNEV